jgi:hypothetical protein
VPVAARLANAPERHWAVGVRAGDGTFVTPRPSGDNDIPTRSSHRMDRLIARNQSEGFVSGGFEAAALPAYATLASDGSNLTDSW